MIKLTKGQLILADGSIFHGQLIGHKQPIEGEVVFNTSMTGYQEILTDPAYFDQIILFTQPVIGSYGINRDDFETIIPFAKGIIVKELSEQPSNFREEGTLEQFLKDHQMTGISGIDTRMLTRYIQANGTMRGTIVPETTASNIESIIDTLNKPVVINAVEQTSTAKPYVIPGRGQRIVLIDLGMKHGLSRELTKRDCHITVVPYDYTAEEIERLKPDGILLSSGPGDPNLLTETIQTIKKLLSKYPMFGIGLGHQLIGLACGATVEKSTSGYRGTSYPVKELENNKTVMTTQNNSFLVVDDRLNDTNLKVTHTNLHDDTIAGLKHTKYPVFSVQFYPEGSPGPEDSIYLFDQFLNLIVKETRGIMND